jgi:hypothetical protein
MKFEWLNLWPWRPGGFISDKEQASQAYSMRHNIHTTAQQYAYFAAVAIDGIQGDDASRGGSPVYIWRDWIVGRYERKQFEQGEVNEGPTIMWEPNMAQLTTAIHGSIVNLWQEIAETQSAGSWGGP